MQSNQTVSDGTVHFGVKFKNFDTVYPISVLTIPVRMDEYVVVETERGNEFGVIALRKEIPHVKKAKKDLTVRRVIRVATQADIDQFHRLAQEEQNAFIECVRKNLDYQLPVKFFKVEKIFDGLRYIIYYKEDEADHKKPPRRKMNLQPFVQELSAQLNARIELREVGNRGEAKLFGGLGSCGKSLCCVNWNKKGSVVTVKMAKEQGLAINIPKLSGVCGRLMCCLSYERDNYQDGQFIK